LLEQIKEWEKEQEWCLRKNYKNLFIKLLKIG
jgi:hypothetical protein